ncbi:MAG TPA: sulfite exporter TauE/SafE family protein [Thermoanaerobaculia bacterium]|nr:sulfite exporter TauE/SafE family protein [Thermoanaerobaculia bacterium]
MVGLLVTAFLVGLAGGIHCVAMCGGFVAALSLRDSRPAARSLDLPRQLGYSLGRVVSYSIAGAAAGALGGLGILYGGILPARMIFLIVANLLVILLGLYLAGFATSVLALEKAGSFLWRGLTRLGARLAPAETPGRAVLVGLAWGWVPCGLVYGVLATALVAGSALRGAAVMAAFGLGTLPNLLAAGLAAEKLRSWTRRPRWRLAAGLAVVVLGVAGLARIPFLVEHLTSGHPGH